MLSERKIISIVTQVSGAQFPPRSVKRVIAEPAVDSQGHDALRITIVLRPDAVARLSGDSVVETSAQIQDRLLAAGEERFPILNYATEEELLLSDDPRS